MILQFENKKPIAPRRQGALVAAIVEGKDLLGEEVARRLLRAHFDWSYEEIDPDIAGDELAMRAYPTPTGSPQYGWWRPSRQPIMCTGECALQCCGHV